MMAQEVTKVYQKYANSIRKHHFILDCPTLNVVTNSRHSAQPVEVGRLLSSRLSIPLTFLISMTFHSLLLICLLVVFQLILYYFILNVID